VLQGQAAAVKAGAVEAVVTTMVAHAGDAKVALQACSALASLTSCAEVGKRGEAGARRVGRGRLGSPPSPHSSQG